MLKPLPERNWPAYNASQVKEASLFDGLLLDLLETVEEPLYGGNGRPPLPLREVMFCAVKKAYTGFSSRRNQGFIEDASDSGLLSMAPHFNAASKLLNRDSTAPLLRRLVQMSALPLAGVEVDFAVDSTGFTTGTFGTYKQQRYGQRKSDWRRDWVKLHAMVGVQSNIVTDAVVTATSGAGTGDKSNFKTLVDTTAESFTINEVSADAGYIGKANLWAVKQVGGEALIPFQGGRNEPSLTMRRGSSSTSNAPGLPGSAKLWRRAYHYFKLHEDEFHARYHKRSNVEATFGAMKQTLGERLKSKNAVAQRNEVLCKVIAWNIRCVVRAMHELGVEPVFGAVAAAPKVGVSEGV